MAALVTATLSGPWVWASHFAAGAILSTGVRTPQGRASPPCFAAFVPGGDAFPQYAFVAGCRCAGRCGRGKKPKQDPVLKGLPIAQLSADKAILNALNRRPRPGG